MVCYALGSPQAEGSPDKKATLVLEDGTKFEGFVFGSPTSVAGEVGKFISRFYFSILFYW